MAQDATSKAIDDDPQPAAVEAFIGYQLKRAYVIVQTDFRAALGEGGLAPRVFTTLSFVVQRPNITQSELARLLGIERSGLVAIIDELEARGDLKRTHVPGDRRVQALVPTDAGRAHFAEALAKVQAHEAALFQDFSESEQAELLRLLQKIRTQGEGT